MNVSVPIPQIIFGFVRDRMKKIALIANALKDQSQVRVERLVIAQESGTKMSPSSVCCRQDDDLDCLQKGGPMDKKSRAKW